MPDISSLTSLKRLDLSFNQFFGNLPHTENLEELEDLRLQNNLFVSTIPPLLSLSKLTMLNISHNFLTGSLPDLSSLQQLTDLDLKFNSFHSEINNATFEHTNELAFVTLYFSQEIFVSATKAIGKSRTYTCYISQKVCV